MDKRSRVISYGSAFLFIVVGVDAAVLFGGAVGQLLAIVLVGLGLVLATALMFYEVGLSEDRERAREEADAAERAARLPGGRRSRFRLQRDRGRRRRFR